MANEWHYTMNGQPATLPVSAAQLKQLAAAGQLKPSDLVWQDGMLEWAAAGSVKGLFPPNPNPGDSGLVPPPNDRPSTSAKTIKIRKPPDWANLHPFVVFVLTLATVGIFGLVFAYQVCLVHRLRLTTRKSDTAGRPLGIVRHPLALLLLSYLTLGVYLFFWASRALAECNEYLGRKDVNPRAELSLMLIFPPYALYVVLFLLPEQIRRTQALAGMPETPGLRHGVFFLLPCMGVGVPLFGMMCQESLNQLWSTTP